MCCSGNELSVFEELRGRAICRVVMLLLCAAAAAAQDSATCDPPSYSFQILDNADSAVCVACGQYLLQGGAADLTGTKCVANHGYYKVPYRWFRLTNINEFNLMPFPSDTGMRNTTCKPDEYQ